MNPIGLAMLQGDAALGWAAFETLKHPSSEDKRWAGTCAIFLGNWDTAQALLEAAVHEGYIEAHTHLALIHRAHGRRTQALFALERLEHEDLSPVERCLHLLERGIGFLAQHDFLQARVTIERSWQRSFEVPEGEFVRPGLAQALGVALVTLGQHQEALRMLEQAMKGGPARATLAGGYRAVVLAYMGRFDEARSQLEQVKGGSAGVRVAAETLGYWSGTLARLSNQPEQARERLEDAVRTARAAQEKETEAHALLGLSATLCALGDYAGARASLSRASPLCDAPGLSALLAMRQGQLWLCLGDTRTAQTLQGALSCLDGLGMARDALWCQLSLLEHALSTLGMNSRGLLEEVTDRYHALGDPLVLSAELTFLPRTSALLGTLAPDDYAHVLRHAQPQLPRLEVLVLGTSNPGVVALEGLALRSLPTQAALLLYYLLSRPGRSVAELVTDLFPERSHRQGSKYFYRIRSALLERISGLELEIGNKLGTGCTLHFNQLTLSVDALKLKDLLSRGDVEAALELYAPLLPMAEGEWIEGERQDLMEFMTQIAVESINNHFKSGDFDWCVKIAERMLKIDPFDPVLNEICLRALEALQGPVSARLRAYQMRDRFAKDGLEPPREVEQFMRLDLN